MVSSKPFLNQQRIVGPPTEKSKVRSYRIGILSGVVFVLLLYITFYKEINVSSFGVIVELKEFVRPSANPIESGYSLIPLSAPKFITITQADVKLTSYPLPRNSEYAEIVAGRNEIVPVYWEPSVKAINVVFHLKSGNKIRRQAYGDGFYRIWDDKNRVGYLHHKFMRLAAEKSRVNLSKIRLIGVVSSWPNQLVTAEKSNQEDDFFYQAVTFIPIGIIVPTSQYTGTQRKKYKRRRLYKYYDKWISLKTATRNKLVDWTQLAMDMVKDKTTFQLITSQLWKSSFSVSDLRALGGCKYLQAYPTGQVKSFLKLYLPVKPLIALYPPIKNKRKIQPRPFLKTYMLEAELWDSMVYDVLRTDSNVPVWKYDFHSLSLDEFHIIPALDQGKISWSLLSLSGSMVGSPSGYAIFPITSSGRVMGSAAYVSHSTSDSHLGKRFQYLNFGDYDQDGLRDVFLKHEANGSEWFQWIEEDSTDGTFHEVVSGGYDRCAGVPNGL